MLDKAKDDATTRAKDRATKNVVKNRDSYRCRWPEPHICRKGLEAAHLLDASLGGLCVSENLITVCAWIHRRGPESIHGKQLEIRPLTRFGAKGPIAGYRKQYSETRRGEYVWRLVGRERSLGVIEIVAPPRRRLRMSL